MPDTIEFTPEPAQEPLDPDVQDGFELALRRYKAKVAKLIAMLAKSRRANGQAGKPQSSISEIQRIVAAKYGVAVSEMLSRRVDIRVSRPRQIAIYLARDVTRHSLIEIGRRFDRDHSTTMHAVRTIGRLRAEDVSFREQVEDLKRFIMGDVDFIPMKEPRPPSRLGGPGVSAKVLTAMQAGASTAAEIAETLNISVVSVTGGLGHLMRSGQIVHVREVHELGREFFVYAIAVAAEAVPV